MERSGGGLTTRASPLDPGVTVVIATERSTAPHQLVLAQQTAERGQVLWVDARDTASTYSLYGLATEQRLLSGIEIARAWTAYQHHILTRQLVKRTTPRTRMLVLPNVCSLYCDDDVDAAVAERLLAGSLRTLRELATAASISVLLTGTPSVRSRLEPHSDTTMQWSDQQVVHQREAPTTTNRYWFQTTIPDWVDEVGCRREQVPIGQPRVGTRQTVLGTETPSPW